jgi:hypothetical protein
MPYVRKITKVMARIVRRKTCAVCLSPLRRSGKEYYCKVCGLEYVLERGHLLVKRAKYV